MLIKALWFALGTMFGWASLIGLTWLLILWDDRKKNERDYE